MHNRLKIVFNIYVFSSLFGTLEKVNELHMDFLSISEFLVEVADDLYASFTSPSTINTKSLNLSESEWFSTLLLQVRLRG